MAIVPGRCPAANNNAEIILAAANTLTGIFSSFLQINFEIMSTSKDMKNSLIMTSSITPPTSRPEMIFGSPGDILYRLFTQLLNDPNISLSPGNKHIAPMIVIIVVDAAAFLSNRNSFHRPTFFEIIKPIAASIRPFFQQHLTLSCQLFSVEPNLFIIFTRFPTSHSIKSVFCPS